MSIRTSVELIDKIAEQLAWRRKELTELRTMVDGSSSNLSRQSTLIRAGIALLYAHWEGFIKCTGSYFLEFVAEQRLNCNQLQPNFLGIILKNKINASKASKKVSSSDEIVKFMLSDMHKRARFPTRDVVKTGSNLSSSELSEIMWILGLDNSPYITKKNLLDERLVNRRNQIAHGEYLDITVEEYLNLHDEVITMVEEFRNQLENASVLKNYIRTPEPA